MENDRYWLVKTEPEAFSWQQLVKDGKTAWDGVRNYLARNHLQAMQQGDLVLVYHSNTGKEIVGIARVIRTAYPDASAGDDPRWVCVDLAPVCALKQPVILKQMKEIPALHDLMLIRQGRLSVMPVSELHFHLILQLAETPHP
ncbi:MAG: EVE domain-containing protein [Bacteroidetes bacterium]|nr:EVE domain-containing protein [Bacteroidota bacterium]